MLTQRLEGTFSRVPFAFYEDDLVTSPATNSLYLGQSMPAYSFDPHWLMVILKPQKRTVAEVTKVLLDKWVADTVFHSSPTIIKRSGYFQEARSYPTDWVINALLPLLDSYPYHAILGLAELVGPLPFCDEFAGDMDGLVRSWKEWGNDRNIERGRAGLVSEFKVDGMGGN